jgi:hypothetical protein
MATVAYPLGTANGGLVTLTLHYDDQSLAIGDVVLVNNGTTGTITLDVLNKGDGSLLTEIVRTANSGALTRNLTNLHLSMVHEVGTGKYGPYDILVPPFDYTIEWANR